MYINEGINKQRLDQQAEAGKIAVKFITNAQKTPQNRMRPQWLNKGRQNRRNLQMNKTTQQKMTENLEEVTNQELLDKLQEHTKYGKNALEILAQLQKVQQNNQQGTLRNGLIMP